MRESLLEERDTSERIGKRRTRTLSCGLGVMAIVVASLVILSPLAAAAPTSVKASTTLKSPYSGTPIAELLYFATGCGYAFKIAALPTFNLTKGVFTSSINSTAKSCAKTDTTFGLEALAGFESSTEFTVSTNGTYAAKANWSLAYTITLAAKSGGTGQFAESYAGVLVGASLDDLTNSSSLLIASYEVVYENSSTPTTHSYSATVALSNAALKLVKGHSYEIEAYAFILADVYCSSGKSSATAGVNMGTGGKKATLTSVVIP